MRSRMRILALILCLCLTAASLPLTVYAASFYGDANQNGTVNTTDIRLVLSHVVGSRELDAKGQHLADVNQDGKVSSEDARLIMRAVITSIDSFKIYSGAKLVTFGDSLTAFGTWPSAVAESCNMTLFNGAMGGTTSAQGLDRFDRYVANRSPDFVTLCFGMNDLIMTEKNVPRVSLEQYRLNMETLAQKVLDLGATPILMTVSYLNEEVFYTTQNQNPSDYADVGGPLAWLDRYNAVLREMADEHGYDLVDIRAACDAYAVTDFLVEDGIHLGVLGNEVYASLITDCIQSTFAADSTVPTVQNTVDYTPSPSEAAIEDIISYRPTDWYTVTASQMQFANDGGALTMCNTNGLWPEAHYALEKAYLVPYENTELVFDFTTANVNASIILFFGGATPSVYQNDQWVVINSKLSASVDSGSGDILGNQTVSGSVRLSDLKLPAGAFDENGNVLISGVKVFVAGTAYETVSFRRLAVQTYGAPTA